MCHVLTHNRVILTHFDSYSTALLFPRWENQTLLWPEALPDSATPMPGPADIGSAYSGAAVKQVVVERCGLNADELEHVGEFKPISQLRGSAMSELLLLRDVFNLIVGGGKE